MKHTEHDYRRFISLSQPALEEYLQLFQQERQEFLVQRKLQNPSSVYRYATVANQVTDWCIQQSQRENWTVDRYNLIIRYILQHHKG